MSFKPSKYQEAVFEFIKNGEGSAVVEAVAGSGKTTTIIKALELIPQNKRVIFLAFNKSIANELSDRVPGHVIAKTLNGLGHGAWARYVDGRPNLETQKTWKLFNDYISPDYTERTIERLGSAAVKLVGLAKGIGIVPSGMDLNALTKDEDSVWDDLIDRYDIQPNEGGSKFESDTEEEFDPGKDREKMVEMARILLKVGIEKRDEMIDFDDQLYLPVIFNIPMFTNDFVFVDEAQDVSKIQRSLIAKTLKRNGRLVAVGDPCQAIYGFRGADSDSMENIVKTFNCKRLPLSTSYRCPQKIVEEAQEVVDHIEAFDGAPEGHVEDRGEYQTDMFRKGDLVVCRNTAPLIRLAYRLIGDRVPATILGRDLAKGIVSLIERMKAKNLVKLTEKLDNWKEREIERLLEKSPKADVSRIEDRVEVVEIFIEMSGANSVSELIKSIENLFQKEEVRNGAVLSQNLVNLSTVHKSKGLECIRVFFLDRWLLPSKYAVQNWQKNQEDNLIYVAITRAKSELHYVNSPKK